MSIGENSGWFQNIIILLHFNDIKNSTQPFPAGANKLREVKRSCLPRVHRGESSEASGSFHLDAANEGVFSIISPAGRLAA